MNDSLFKDQNNNNQPSFDETKNYFEELVGDGKKFKTPEELAKGKAYSDSYIKILERQLDEMREDNRSLRETTTTQASVQEVLDQLKRQQSTSSEDTLNANRDQIRQPAYDPKEIESLVSSKIQEHELTKRQQENYNLVRNKLVEQYGPNFQDKFNQQMESLGLTEDFVNDLAKKHPQVLFKTFGLDQTQRQDTFQNPPRTQRSDTFSPSAPKRTWSYYQELKKKNPELYNNPKTIVQMQNDAIALGEAFEDGDFHRFN